LPRSLRGGRAAACGVPLVDAHLASGSHGELTIDDHAFPRFEPLLYGLGSAVESSFTT
jgi:hypothetical protein